MKPTTLLLLSSLAWLLGNIGFVVSNAFVFETLRPSSSGFLDTFARAAASLDKMSLTRLQVSDPVAVVAQDPAPA